MAGYEKGPSSWHGHLWTVLPRVRSVLAPLEAPRAEPWETRIGHPSFGEVRLTGAFVPGDAASRDALVIVVHGLGGSAESPYVGHAVLEAARIGMPSLRIHLRGADRLGEDFYHAGLTADLRAALTSERGAAAKDVYLLGYSLGGHLVMRYLSEEPDPRIRAAAVICAPLDLERGVGAIDAPASALYRRHVLRGLREMYAEVAARRSVPISVEEAARVRTVRGWDELIVSKHHGFQNAADYYAQTSAAPRLGRVRVPTLYVGALFDPMVPHHTVEPALRGVPSSIDVRMSDRGGHVGFPASLDLGIHAPRGLEPQVLAWLTSR